MCTTFHLAFAIVSLQANVTFHIGRNGYYISSGLNDNMHLNCGMDRWSVVLISGTKKHQLNMHLNCGDGQVECRAHFGH